MTLPTYLGVLVLGGIGAVLRFLLDGRLSARTGRAFPYGTLAVNISGALLLGVVTGLAPSHEIALLVGTATIGAYTTFSTWMFETQRLAEDRQLAGPLANLAASAALGLAAAMLGQLIGVALGAALRTKVGM
jgi:CrcB protein